jgi:hypothetical protein
MSLQDLRDEVMNGPKPKCIVCKKAIGPTGGCLHEQGWWHHIVCSVNPEEIDQQYRAAEGDYQT